MLSQLIYVSVRASECSDSEIQKILESSIHNNAKIDITGVLLYSDKKFLQCLEGDYDEIMALYDKIKLDKRHKNVVLITVGMIKECFFPSWQMGSKKIDQNYEFSTNMSLSEKKDFNAILKGEKPSESKANRLNKKILLKPNPHV